MAGPGLTGKTIHVQRSGEHCIRNDFICHADTLLLLCQDEQCDTHEFLSTVFEFAEQD